MTERPECPVCLGSGSSTLNKRQCCFVCNGWGVVDSIEHYKGGSVTTLDQTRPAKPRALIICEQCSDDCNAHPVEHVQWDGVEWLCGECFGENRRAFTSWENAPVASTYITVQLPPKEST